jgi:phosphate transport system permease protein
MTPRDIAAARLYRRRRLVNILAIGLACAAAVFGLFFLGWILWTLLSKGLAHLSLSLFTQMTSRHRSKRAACAMPSSAA